MLIIFAGAIGGNGIGGAAWARLQYVAGLLALGHEVVYLEDPGAESWVYDWENAELTSDTRYPAEYIASCLNELKIGARWIYRTDTQSEGLSVDEFADACADADLLLIHAAILPVWRPEYDLPERRAFIDVDPGFTQISLAQGDAGLNSLIERCERLFTIAPGLAAGDTRMPMGGRKWHHSWPPVSLPHWPFAEQGPATHFSTVMRWRGFHDAEYGGRFYGQKDREMPKFIDLPRLTDQPLTLAHLGADEQALAAYGWDVIPGEDISLTPGAFRTFVQESRAELGIAKHGYVRMQNGWFSDRSVCYLASGRPVLLQDTGIAPYLPVGEGIVLFNDIDEARQGIEKLNADYSGQRTQARRVAEEIFSADEVIPRLLDIACS